MNAKFINNEVEAWSQNPHFIYRNILLIIDHQCYQFHLYRELCLCIRLNDNVWLSFCHFRSFFFKSIYFCFLIFSFDLLSPTLSLLSPSPLSSSSLILICSFYSRMKSFVSWLPQGVESYLQNYLLYRYSDWLIRCQESGSSLLFRSDLVKKFWLRDYLSN